MRKRLPSQRGCMWKVCPCYDVIFVYILVNEGGYLVHHGTALPVPRSRGTPSCCAGPTLPRWRLWNNRTIGCCLLMNANLTLDTPWSFPPAKYLKLACESEMHMSFVSSETVSESRRISLSVVIVCKYLSYIGIIRNKFCTYEIGLSCCVLVVAGNIYFIIL